METKICSKCKVPQDIATCFYPRPSRKSGVQSQCKSCQKKHSMSYAHRYKDKQSGYQSVQYQKNKALVIEAYGGQCVCCGEAEPRFMTIDHINGDGAESRKNGEGHGGALYQRLKMLGFPKDRYQLLCFNCNCSKRQFGTCPHKSKLVDTSIVSENTKE